MNDDLLDECLLDVDTMEQIANTCRYVLQHDRMTAERRKSLSEGLAWLAASAVKLREKLIEAAGVA